MNENNLSKETLFGLVVQYKNIIEQQADRIAELQKAKTLTDEEITDIAHTLLIATDAIEYEWGICVTQFARAILKKAIEK